MPRQEQLISREERDKLIIALARKGWSHSKIAAYVPGGMSRRGVGMALERIVAEGAEPHDDEPRHTDNGHGNYRSPRT